MSSMCCVTTTFSRCVYAIGGLLLSASPALALEEVVIEIPLLETSFTVNLVELESAEGLRLGNSDLAELDRASDGAVGRKLRELFEQPVPLSVRQVAEASARTPLLEQAMLMLSSLGEVEGRPPDLSGITLNEALLLASGDGEPTILGLMKAIPGERVTIRLERTIELARKMTSQRDLAERLLASIPPVAPPTSGGRPGTSAVVQRRKVQVAVPHRSAALAVEVLQPAGESNNRLVLISHGLWDDVGSFVGWGERLAAHGYTVLLPYHPGSDREQQASMLSGASPPPGPEELALRAKDLSALLDAAAVQRLPVAPALQADRVVVIGHSWGGTTALQLAGITPRDERLRRNCENVDHPDRNLSWALQCSWLQGVLEASNQDRRVIAIASVSPPASLVFPKGSGVNQSARVLVVSGSSDWIVPPDPEAIKPMSNAAERGNQLVLVKAGDHFNLRPGADATGGILGPLLVSWTDAAFAAGASVAPTPGAPPLLPPTGWGNRDFPMADVTGALASP